MTRTKWPCILLFPFSVFSPPRDGNGSLTAMASGETGKKARAVCICVGYCTTFVVAIGRKKNFLMEPWRSSLQYGKKEKEKLFSPTRCLWEHSTFSSICFYITVQAWTNNESSLGTSILRFLSFFSSTTYRKNEIIPVDFFLISSGKKWKWSLSLSFFFC